MLRAKMLQNSEEHEVANHHPKLIGTCPPCAPVALVRAFPAVEDNNLKMVGLSPCIHRAYVLVCACCLNFTRKGAHSRKSC